jgi:putative FmdB family regulatory protein
MTEADVPTYQYACTACGHQLEAVQKFSDAPLTECPNCTGRLRKMFSSVGVVFKGSGFYRTDSRAKDAASTPAKSESKSESKSEGKSESKSESSTSSTKTEGTTSSSAKPASTTSSSSSTAA